MSILDQGGVFERLARRPELLRPAFHPIADLKYGVVAGYEVVLGFDGEAPASPRAWSRSAHAVQAGTVEALVLRAALAVRSELPHGCFLAVSVSAAGVLSPQVQDVLEELAPLEGVVIVVSDDSDAADARRVRHALGRARDAHATIAIDETVSGYASLKQILRLRPEYVRIGADFVEDVGRDHAKAAVVETLAALASRIDAWVLAGGVRRRADLGVLRRMGVPLAQGPLFGEALPQMRRLCETVEQAIHEAEEAPPPEQTIVALVEERPSLPYGASLDDVAEAFLDDPRHDVIVMIDEAGRPLALAERAALLRGEAYERPVTRITPATPIKAVARRAAARPPLERFHPLVACDRRGAYIGVVRVEQLLDALAQD